jgi:23S rRNA maturation-related 3'-5' exoribonuclease YhaM
MTRNEFIQRAVLYVMPVETADLAVKEAKQYADRLEADGIPFDPEPVPLKDRAQEIKELFETIDFSIPVQRAIDELNNNNLKP